MPSKEELIKSIEAMTVMELNEFIKLLKAKLNITTGALGVTENSMALKPSIETKTTFKVTLTKAGPNKILMIKSIREITGLGLKESKAVVENLPSTVKENLTKAQAEEIQTKMKALGAEVELK